MEEDDILYQSIIADPEQVSSDVDVSGLRTETDTSPQLLAAVSEFPGLQYDPTQYSSYADLYDLYSRGLPMADTGTTATDTITTPVVETPITDTSAGDQVTGNLTSDLTTDPINTGAQQDLIDQGIGVQLGQGQPISSPAEGLPQTQEQLDAFNQIPVAPDPAIANAALSGSFYVPNQTGAEIEQPGVLDNISTAARNAFETVKSGASTAVDFISSYGYPAYQALSGNLVAAGLSVLNPLTLGLGFAGKVFEGLGDTASNQEYNSYTEEQKAEIDKAYAPGGIMQGYNAVSGFGQGVSGTVQDRIDTIEETIASGNRVATPEQLADPNFNSLEKKLDKLYGLQDKGGLTKRPTQDEIFDRDDVDPADEGITTEEQMAMDLDKADEAFAETGDYDVYSGTSSPQGPDYSGEVTTGTTFDAEDDGGSDDTSSSSSQDQGETTADGAGVGEYTGSGDEGVSGSTQQSGQGRQDPEGGGGGSSGGGKIVCTMMNETYGFGSFRNKIWLRQSKDLAPEYEKGYHKIFLPLVKLSKTNIIVRKILEHIAVHRTIDIRQEARGKRHILGRVYRKVLEPICYLVGKYGKR